MKVLVWSRSRLSAHRRGLLLVVLAVTLAAVAGRATAGQVVSAAGPGHATLMAEARVPTDSYTPVVATVVHPPTPVLGADRRVHLAYELVLLNTTPSTVTLRRIDAVSPAGGVLATLSGARLASHMGSVTGAPGVRLGPGQSGFAVMDVPLRPHSAVPSRLSHRVTISASGLPPGPFATGRTEVSAGRAVRIGAPLAGARWVNVDGCCADATAHRTALLAVNGALHLAQRFAIDVVRLQPDGRLVVGPLSRLASYPYYGTRVRSVADGVVVRVRDGLPDQVPFEPPKGITVGTAPGNHVVVALGQGRFALYAHLEPGTIGVSVGQHVSAGQVLGRLGNSGNSDLPHLHFQVMNAPSPLGSEGLPFVLRTFRSPGSVPPIDAIDPTQPIPIGPELRGRFHDVMPLHRQVMDLPGR